MRIPGKRSKMPTYIVTVNSEVAYVVKAENSSVARERAKDAFEAVEGWHPYTYFLISTMI